MTRPLAHLVGRQTEGRERAIGQATGGAEPPPGDHRLVEVATSSQIRRDGLCTRRGYGPFQVHTPGVVVGL